MKIELRSVRADARRKSSVRLRSGYRRQSLSLDEPLCRDFMLPQFLFPLYVLLLLAEILESQLCCDFNRLTLPGLQHGENFFSQPNFFFVT